MPIYDFECQECGFVFEVIDFKIRDKLGPGLYPCIRCGVGRAKKIMSASNFHLKGSGFYATDYRKPKGRVRENKDGN